MPFKSWALIQDEDTLVAIGGPGKIRNRRYLEVAAKGPLFVAKQSGKPSRK